MIGLLGCAENGMNETSRKDVGASLSALTFNDLSERCV